MERLFGLETRSIDHFDTQLATTLNYSAIADFHTLRNHALFQSALSSLVVAW
jgi:hypothetical protein